MNFPEELKYTADHEWIRLEGDVAYVGITEFAQQELGDIVYVEVESEGETFEKGETFGSIEAVKTVSDLYLPLSGEVLEKNEALEGTPEIVNSDPYAEGWIIKMSIANADEIGDLLDVNTYKTGLKD